MQTNIPVGSPLARKIFGTALFTVTQRQPTFSRMLVGAAPKQSSAEAKMKGQTSADMPFVRVTDLSRSAGDTVSIDLVNIIGGKPIMSGKLSEGLGAPLTFSSMDVKIDMYVKPIDAGGKMHQQRTVHDLRGLALANGAGYMARLEDQLSFVHLAGARGSQTGLDWIVPPQSDADFAAIAVNSVKAPTYNRHYVVDGANLVAGGAQLGNVDSTDLMKLSHLDALRVILDDLEFKMQPVRVEDDPAKNDAPMYVLLCPPRVYGAIIADATANASIRQFQQYAWERKSYGSKHPLFLGEVGMWNGILVKKMDRSIRFLPSDTTKIVTSANRYAGTESDQTVNAGLTAGYGVERSLLVGAQALAFCYGRNQSSDYYYSWKERMYNFENNLEVQAEAMGGRAKVRFNVPALSGSAVVDEPTDMGVMAIDSVVRL